MNDDNKTEAKEKCKCGKPGRQPHTCPFREDVHNDTKTRCNCCRKCEQNCADGI